ncbi:MAG: hypothetical protein IK079_03975, partial [Desulfovibrio sp.]|nr:hypothetical protein [Desulfovibrio sp.]
MGLIGNMGDAAVSKILNHLRDTVFKDLLEGVADITEINYKDKTVSVKAVLKGLEDKAITVTCHSIKITKDGEAVKLKDFTSNMPFAATLLNRYLAKYALPIPEGPCRLA